MDVPSHCQETRTEVMHRLMRQHSLGTLVTLGGTGLEANHVPFEIDAEAEQFGVLRAHLPRNNPVWRDCSFEVDALVVFQGAQAYVSPSWYATKKDDERVVPTYNFMVVHAYGPLRVIDDPEWVHAHLERLTNRHERGSAQPWKVSDAPADFIGKLLPVLVGIEIPIVRLIGKWKVSQNQPAVNRAGVVQGLRAQGGDTAAARAEAVAQR